MIENSNDPEKSRGALIAVCSFDGAQQKPFQENYDKRFTDSTDRARVLEGILIVSPDDKTLFGKVFEAMRLASIEIVNDPNNKSLLTPVFDHSDKGIEGYDPNLWRFPVIAAEHISTDDFLRVIVLLIPHNTEMEHYIRARNLVIEKANSILETFGINTLIPDPTGVDRFPTLKQ